MQAKPETLPSSLAWRFTPFSLLLVISPRLPMDCSPLWIRIGTEVLMWAALAQSWNIIGGYTGYLCFGHGVFFGLGAYVTGLMMVRLGWPFGIGLVVFRNLCLPPGGHHWLPDPAVTRSLFRHRHLGLW